MLEKLKNNKKLIINIIGGVAGIIVFIYPEPTNLTTWQELAKQTKEFIGNPYEIGLALVATYGYITNLK